MLRSIHSIRIRTAAILLLPALLAGCAVLAPRYNAALDTNVASADEQVEAIAAKVDLGLLQKPESFAGVSDSYVEAISKLAVAKEQAGGLPVQGSVASRERTNLATIIDRCADQVKSLATLHQGSGLAPNAGLTGAMKVACSEAVRAVQAQKQ